MGLRESRIIREVHPWLGVRLQWLQDVAKIFGSNQQLISGNRTKEEQRRLFGRLGSRPVAAPGCSQHQYGFAADAQYSRASHISSKGRGILLSQNETDRFFQSAAHHVSLTTVNNDPGHLQIYPGAEFRSWAERTGRCDPRQLGGFNIETVDRQNRAYRDCLSEASRSNRLLGSKSPRFLCRLPCGPLFGIPC